jgi:hypothetical protein
MYIDVTHPVICTVFAGISSAEIQASEIVGAAS